MNVGKINESVIKKQIKKYKNSKTKLYINYPFCENRCYYCVYSIDKFSEKKSNMFLASLEKEVECYKKILKNYKFKDLYIGGGSPNLVSPDKLLKNINGIVDFDNLYRFVVEVFPRDDMQDYIKKLKRYNVTKIQIGAQTLNEKSLKKENRLVTKKIIIKSMEAMSKSGLIWAVDLMNGFVSEKKDDYEKDLKTVLDLKPTGIHLYDMRLQKENEFYYKKRNLKYDKYKKVNQMHELKNMLLDSGYIKVGDEWCLKTDKTNINYAKKNKKTRGESNTVAVGLGARTRIGRIKYMNTKNLEKYKDMLEKNILPVERIFNYGENLYSIANLLMEINGPLKFNFKDIFRDSTTTKEDMKEVYKLILYLKKNGIKLKEKNEYYGIDLDEWSKCISLIEEYLEKKANMKYFYKN